MVKSKVFFPTVHQLLFHPVIFYAKIHVLNFPFRALKEHGEYKEKNTVQKEDIV